MGERAKFLQRLLNSSEMYCSLKYESASGCSYGVFKPRDVAMLALVCMLCAALSLVVGM